MAVATRKRPEGSDWQLIPGRVAVEGFFVVIVEGKNHLGVSEYSGFSPQIMHSNRVFHYKPSILGVPLFLETSIYWGWTHWMLMKEGEKILDWKKQGTGRLQLLCYERLLLSSCHTPWFQTPVFFASCISLKIAPIRIWLLKKKSWNKPMQQQTSTTRCWFMSNSLP